MTIRLLGVNILNGIYIFIGYMQYFSILFFDFYCVDEKVWDKKKIIPAFFANIIILILYSYIGVYIQILNFLSCFVFNLFFGKKLVDNILFSSLSCSMLILADHLISFIFYYNKLGILERLLVEEQTLFSLLLRAILYIIIMSSVAVGVRKIWRKIENNPMIQGICTAFIVILYLILCSIIFSANAEGNQLTTVLLNSFFITLYFTFTVFLLLITYFYMKKRGEDQYKEREKRNLREYTTYLESNYNELRKFRHDYQNILTSLESFIEEDDFERLKDYYYQSIKKTQRLMQKNEFKLSEISRLEITEIKSIVISKLLHSQLVGIETDLEIKEVIDDINMDPVTLIRCLGIILDNAIEETKGNTEGFIRMAIIKEICGISFIVQNTIRADHPKLFEMNRSGFSTKGENRGLGLSNLKEMIDKQANVTLESSIENQCFVQKIEITR